MMKKHRGLLIAISILGLWGIALGYLLNFGSLSPWLAFFEIAGMTFLYTGLFITAHDAMHGLISPWSAVNDFFGSLVLVFYAGFSFHKLRAAHRLHHQYPGTARDPDWHTPKGSDAFFPWFTRFFLHYFKLNQLLALALVVSLIQSWFQLNPARVTLFWVLPSILSSLQLFYFGTYLPHKGKTFADRHRSQTTQKPSWLTFLQCYHFGIHHEHHLYPHLAWWELPQHRNTFPQDKQAHI